MGKAITPKRVLRLMGVYLNNVCLDGVSDDTVEWALHNQQEAGAQFSLFLQNGGRVVIGGLTVAPAPFDPVAFIGEGWSIIPEEHDARNDGLQEVDLGRNMDLVHCLNDGETITGEVKLARLKALRLVRYGLTVAKGVWDDYQARKENSVLETLHRTRGITYLDFPGDVLLNPDGDRHVLYLYRDGDGRWHWNCR